MPNYREIEVSQEEVALRRADLASAPKEKRYGRWRAYRHYMQLRHNQLQGYHFNFMNECGIAICTCGLEMSKGDLADILPQNSDLKLQPLQLVAGHRTLPSFEDLSVALIVNHRFDWNQNEYLWTAYCQVCRQSVVDFENFKAKSFVEIHNNLCRI